MKALSSVSDTTRVFVFVSQSVFATVFSFMKALKRFRHNDCFLLFSDLAPSPFTVAIYWRLLQTRKYIGSD